MSEEFVSESIKPVAGTFDAAGMTRGEPGLPARFVWREQEYAVADVVEAWKESGPCRSGGSEMYLRKHWFKIETESGEVMKIYYERQAKSKRQAKQRWVLFTLVEGDGAKE